MNSFENNNTLKIDDLYDPKKELKGHQYHLTKPLQFIIFYYIRA